MHLLITLAAIMLPVLPVSADSDIEGIWAHDPAWCANAHLIGQAEKTPIRITAESITGLENHCTITARSESGDGLTLDLACRTEGVDHRETAVLLTVVGYLVRFYPDTQSVLVFVRCRE